METVRKYKILPLHFPIDGYSYNVQQWTSVDGGKTFWYCGFGKYCRTIEECKEYIKNQGGNENE